MKNIINDELISGILIAIIMFMLCYLIIDDTHHESAKSTNLSRAETSMAFVYITEPATNKMPYGNNYPNEDIHQVTTSICSTATTEPVIDNNKTESEQEWTLLGIFRLTAYCPCERCCGEWALSRPTDKNGNYIVYTASGKEAQAGFTIAADTSLLPFGTRVYINGIEYEVQDVGSAIKGDSIDIYFDDHEEARAFGVKYADVYIKNNVN